MVNFESFFRLKKHRPAEEPAGNAQLRGVLEAAGGQDDTRGEFQREAAPAREPQLADRSAAEITEFLERIEADVRAMSTSLNWQETDTVAAEPALAADTVEVTMRAEPAEQETIVAEEPVVDNQPTTRETAFDDDNDDAPLAEIAADSEPTVGVTQAVPEYEHGDESMDVIEDGEFYEVGESPVGTYRAETADDVQPLSSFETEMRDYEERRTAASAGEPSNSTRLAEFAAFRAITDELEEKLRSFAETVSMSRLTASSMTPFLTKIEGDIQMSEEVERERDLLAGDLHEARRSLEATERELDAKSAALESAVERAEELQADLDQRRVAHQDLLARYERLRKEHERAQSDAAEARVEIVRLSAAVARETAEKESYFRSRIEISNKYAKLQQAEAQARNKYLELTIQYEKVAKTQPYMVAEQEKLRNELRASQREVASLQNRLLAAQDRTSQLETEMQALQGFSASEAYSTRTELEMQKSALRVAEKSIAEAEMANKDIQRMLRDSEANRAALDEQIAELQAELKAVRDERADAAFKLSDVNLKYMADLLALDQQREQNKEFQNNIETLLAEKQRMGRYEALYKAAEGQIVSLKEKLSLLAENLKDSTDPEKLRRSIEIIGELTAPHVAANTDKPPRGSGRKVATH